jgi:hypothetical protein
MSKLLVRRRGSSVRAPGWQGAVADFQYLLSGLSFRIRRCNPLGSVDTLCALAPFGLGLLCSDRSSGRIWKTNRCAGASTSSSADPPNDRLYIPPLPRPGAFLPLQWSPPNRRRRKAARRRRRRRRQEGTCCRST